MFGFFALVLTLVYWINRAVILFDQLIANGQSAGTFLELTALALPEVIRIVLPIAAFAATVYAANRMASESELVVVQATGYSPLRLARAPMFFGVFVMAFVLVLSNALVPAAQRELTLRQAELSRNVTARLLTEGKFVHPAPGMTFYVREITPEGELRDVFMSDNRNPANRVTYTASVALLIRADTGPKLVMYDGMAQTLNVPRKVLTTTVFSDFAFDIGALVNGSLGVKYGLSAQRTGALLNPSDELLAELGRSKARLQQVAHERFSQALLAPAAVLIGFGALLLGGFSRFGLWRQIIGAIVLLIVVKSIDNTMIDAARRKEGAWVLQYIAPLIGMGLGFGMLWWSGRPLAGWKTRRNAKHFQYRGDDMPSPKGGPAS